MEIAISSVTNGEEEFEMLNLRKEVFETELGIVVDSLCGLAQKQAQHLLVHAEPCREAVACMSLVDTSDDHQLHRRYGLNFAPQARIARYAQLAVARPYRGLGIPLMLILEAHRRYAVAKRFDYTWLLYQAERAAGSSFCRLLDFVPSDNRFQSEWGDSRILLRDESAAGSTSATRRAERHLQRFLESYSLSVRFEPDGRSSERSLPGARELGAA
ncbi:MAG TPA: hypothetical protein VJ302_17145 [Blastocatellia bacterium]|nr:hypothetical protein [Blastocatellia bacterium]